MTDRDKILNKTQIKEAIDSIVSLAFRARYKKLVSQAYVSGILYEIATMEEGERTVNGFAKIRGKLEKWIISNV